MTPFKKPARGPTPDGLAIQERNKFDEKLEAAAAQLVAAKAAVPALEQAAAEASIEALINPSSANAKAEEAAAKALTDGQARVTKVENLIGYIKSARARVVDEVVATEHKRALNTTHRNLDKRDGFASDLIEKATALLTTVDAICVANDAAYSAKPTWPGSTDNSLGLSPGSFRWKLAHELWRIASEMGVPWPEAARESTISDRNLTLADRLKSETVNVMDRLRQRPIPSTISAPVVEAPAVAAPGAAPVIEAAALAGANLAESNGPTVSAQSIPLRRETLTV